MDTKYVLGMRINTVPVFPGVANSIYKKPVNIC